MSNNYEEIYNSLFKDIVENPDGTLNKDQVMRELSDYSVFLEQVSKVYCEITEGRISKPNTLAEAVISVKDEIDETRLVEIYQEMREEIIHELQGVCKCGGF